jgi:hypothetical protein
VKPRGPGAALLAALLGACASSGAPSTTSPSPRAPEGAAAPAPSTGRGQEISYAPARGLYRLDRVDTVQVQLPDNSTQSQIFSRSAWLRVTTTKAASGLRATVVLDSLDVTGLPRNATGPIDSARGTEWTATVAPNGALSDIAANRKTLVGEQLGAMLQLLFPTLPGESVRAGATWSDTTNTTTKVDLFDVREQAVTEYAALSSAARGGRTALPIQANTSFTQQGSTTQGGQALQIEARGNRRFTYYFGLDGIPAGLSGHETSEVDVTVSAVGQSIRAARTASVTVTPLPGR